MTGTDTNSNLDSSAQWTPNSTLGDTPSDSMKLGTPSESPYSTPGSSTSSTVAPQKKWFQNRVYVTALDNQATYVLENVNDVGSYGTGIPIGGGDNRQLTAATCTGRVMPDANDKVGAETMSFLRTHVYRYIPLVISPLPTLTPLLTRYHLLCYVDHHRSSSSRVRRQGQRGRSFALTAMTPSLGIRRASSGS